MTRNRKSPYCRGNKFPWRKISFDKYKSLQWQEWILSKCLWNMQIHDKCVSRLYFKLEFICYVKFNIEFNLTSREEKNYLYNTIFYFSCKFWTLLILRILILRLNISNWINSQIDWIFNFLQKKQFLNRTKYKNSYNLPL